MSIVQMNFAIQFILSLCVFSLVAFWFFFRLSYFVVVIFATNCALPLFRDARERMKFTRLMAII